MDYVLCMPPLRLRADVASWRYRLYAFPRPADPLLRKAPPGSRAEGSRRRQKAVR